ncbi:MULTISPECIES: DUF2000 domain-containing protein [unclassified Burkholderia]|uniref:DUF2000 domain-containing protein n=1 Tax=unclassified Burkholderia TaxID=2613784 RepID=UPI0014228272|nr:MULTISPECIES: DUF2000 domain-containing protein [unclassified Burkholderia]NIE86641.1 DUF2000 domain-containing protein [Burkholderia sp. Tr-860]NIF64418.1 DUF2000 domain-containing protein [Burkholderia sp. Cy-647]NIF91556.1 DUF2000 domain-containing protein [Burkholderia sp. Cy-637]NIF99708.1 DUF2000 domain-containing protein [Burkholderia sp. Ax-1720]
MNPVIPEHSAAPVAERCVIVVDNQLPPGRAANAAAVLALTLGQRQPALVGPPLVDADGVSHPGLIPIGIAVLSAEAARLPSIRDKAVAAGCEVVDFPVQGQQTTDYSAFRDAVAQVTTAELAYLGVALVGPRKAIGKIVSNLGLLK